MTKRVFISYRRDDTAAAAGRVYDRLKRLFGAGNVFFDVSAIGGGEDFERRILSEIDRSDVVLVFIGHKWLEVTDSEGRPRLFAEDDYVRAEIRAALGRTVLVLPVLIDGARMPSPAMLPNDIGAICTRNAVALRHESFDADVEKIVRAIQGLSIPAEPQRASVARTVAYGIGGTAVALLAMTVLAAFHLWMRSRPLSATIGDTATTILLALSAIVGAWTGIVTGRRRRGRFDRTATR
jgi:hypothetical protein